jgi:hypothetical protein
MKNLLRSKVLVPALSVVAAVASSSSFAALSEQATAAQTQATGDAASYIGMAWAITTVVTMGFFGIKMFKRAMGKA